jgi:hypothetical protein
MDSAHRVARRYLQAKEFPSDKALQDYLKEHPKADKANHSVAPAAKHPEPKKEPEESGNEPKVPLLPAKLDKRIAAAIKKLPKEAHKFLTDPEHRKKALSTAAEEIKKAPGTFARNALKHSKDEIAEFKACGTGVKALLTGKKVTPEQSKAMQTVARDVAVQIAVVALLGGGGLASKSIYGFVTGIAKKISINAITADGIGDVQGDMEDVRDIITAGKYTAKVLFKFFLKRAKEEGGEEMDPMEIYAQLVAARVSKELDKLTIEDILDTVE